MRATSTPDLTSYTPLVVSTRFWYCRYGVLKPTNSFTSTTFSLHALSFHTYVPSESGVMTAATAKSHHHPTMPTTEGKRTFSGLAVNPNQKVNGSTGQKIKNFFRINAHSKNNLSSSTARSDSGSLEKDVGKDGLSTPQTQSTQTKGGLRSSRFIPHIGRTRSTTVVSEGNTLDEAMSPTAQVNPYFQHQGMPALRHHNDNSVPSSPPDTPDALKKGADGSLSPDAAQAGGKEELARKLRRVASAPNAQGLLTKASKSSGNAEDNDRPVTGGSDGVSRANGKVGAHSNASALSMAEMMSQDDQLLPVPGIDGKLTPGKIRSSVAFRRTYSSNSIKVRDVEVGPSSFDKIKMIGKGDVGKVYLVREKRSSRLYAMKGASHPFRYDPGPQLTVSSPVEERDDQTQQDQTGARRAGNPGNLEPPVHRHPLSFISVRRPSLFVHGVLQWGRVFPSIADPAQQVCRRGRRQILCRRGHRCVGVPAPDGLHLSRFETGE